MEIAVLHRGRGLVVVDKPAGLPVESDGADCVVKLLARQLGPKGGRAWPRVVHRLDTETSGCLAIALDTRAEAELRAAFESGQVEKEYLALIAGIPPEIGSYDTAYGPDAADRRRFTTRLQTPRRARLSFATVEKFAGSALVRVKLDTGRTHQIRVQFAEAGYPVLGDSTYGNESSAALGAQAGIARHALHAELLALPDPDGPGEIRCTAPLPADLAAALERLR